MMSSIQAIVLAAGKSTRFGEFFNKLLIPLSGKPLITHVTDILQVHNIASTIVVGHLKEKIIAALRTREHAHITFAVQAEALGTGHALICSKELWEKDNILVLNGDMPLITADLITTLVAQHIQSNVAVTFVTARPIATSHAYGRVINNSMSIHIVEAKDFNGDTTYAYPINAGIYLFKKTFLEQYTTQLKPNNAQHQLYITDLIGIASSYELGVNTVECAYDIVHGVNTLSEFIAVREIIQARVASQWLERGVLIEDPQNTFIDTTVQIGIGTRIQSGVHIRGTTIIGSHCIINSYVIIEDSIIEDTVTILSHSVIHTSIINSYTHVGPFAHIHNHSTINEKSYIGNFVEIKKSSIGRETKAKHLSYVGDATVGDQVNVGAGTITCNYNGISKVTTVIENNSFIGANSTLVAPLTIGTGAYTAAGSTITQNVPSNALAIARTRQINKSDYAKRLRKTKTASIPTSSTPSSSHIEL